ncbi:MAG TPA: RDD family protein [Mycobacteriales bacterium]|nr:RDD family protein [Mycobacteriales bacterium]
MTQPYDPNQPPAYGSAPPPPAYGGPAYGGYGPPPGQRINDPAPMGLRLLARIIDGVLMFVVLAILIALIGLDVFHKTQTASGTQYDFSAVDGDFYKVSLLFLAITVAYEVGMIASKGATLGKMAVGVRVAMLENGQNPTLSAAFIRWLIPAVAGLIPTGLAVIVVYLSPFFDSTHRNRGWYDYAAKTIAVRTR